MPKPVREIFDFATLVDNKQELVGNSIRRAFEFDAYSDQDTFEAVVLTTPIPQSPDQLSSLTSGEIKDSDRVTKFSYRARIVGSNSPHLFLPDPCDSSYVVDPTNNAKIIAMHTLFISHEEYGVGTSLPRIGSKVQVKLSKNVNGYNLQIGEHLKVVSSPDSDSSTTDSACTSLQNILNNVQIPTSLGATSATRSTRQINFVDILNHRLLEFGFSSYVTSWTRSPELQTKLVFQKSVAEVNRVYRSETVKRLRAAGDVNGMLEYYRNVSGGHLGGAAVDLRTYDKTVEQVKQMIQTILDMEGGVVLEPISTGCWSPAGTIDSSEAPNVTRSTSVEKCYNQHIHVSIPAKYTSLTFENYLSNTTTVAPDELPPAPPLVE